MQLILFTFFFLALQTKQPANPTDYFDPYDYDALFDPSIPDLKEPSPVEFLNNNEKTNSDTSFNFTIFPRSIINNAYFLKGIETIFLTQKTASYLGILFTETKYYNQNLLVDININQDFAFSIEQLYQKNTQYESLKILGNLLFKKQFFATLTINSGFFLYNKTIHPVLGLNLGQRERALSYYQAKKFTNFSINLYPSMNNNSFFSLGFCYSFPIVFSDSLIKMRFTYLYEYELTPTPIKTKIGTILKAYSIFTSIPMEKLLSFDLSYSIILFPRIYGSLIYQGAFFFNSLARVSIKDLNSSFALEFSYVSQHIKQLRYFIYYAVGSNDNYKIMLGIKS